MYTTYSYTLKAFWFLIAQGMKVPNAQRWVPTPSPVGEGVGTLEHRRIVNQRSILKIFAQIKRITIDI